jgi:ABC-type molybdate transport system substrate-binding protein
MTLRQATTIGAAALVFASEAESREPIRVFAAGSLRAVMTELALASTDNAAARPQFVFGASGLLRDRLMGGERADVFASANLEHPQALVRNGLGAIVLPFTRNRLCALAAPRIDATPETLLDALLDPGNKLGTSTPRADPSGDYAWQLFDKAEALRPGARDVLVGKARKLTGGPDSPPPPADRNVYAMLVERGEADLFLTYCTNAKLALRELPTLKMIETPDALGVGADYGVVVLKGASANADAFVRFVLSPAGQRILGSHGFGPLR